MAIIVYSSERDADEQRLLERISFTDVDICRSVGELRRRLNTACDRRKIIILSVKDHEEVTRIAGLMELYSDLLLIVILEHDDPATNRAAFRLRPRYIAYKADGFNDVAAILHRIIHRYD